MTNFKDYPDWVTTKQARELIPCGKTKMFELVKSEKVRSRKIGRLRYIPKVDLEKFVKKREEK